MGGGDNGIRSRSDRRVGSAAQEIWAPCPLPRQAARSPYTNTWLTVSSSPARGQACCVSHRVTGRTTGSGRQTPGRELHAQPQFIAAADTLLWPAGPADPTVRPFCKSVSPPKRAENWSPPGSHSTSLHLHHSICRVFLKMLNLSISLLCELLESRACIFKNFTAPASSKYPDTKRR